MGDYSFILQPDGTLRYTQVVRWEHVDDVLFYDVTVRDGTGKELSTTRVTEPELRLSLAPGNYSYRIVLYNVFRKPEISLPWQELTVLKADIPKVVDFSPKILFLDDLKPEISLRGENLMPGATIALRREASASAPILGRELSREGTKALHVVFPEQDFAAGRYSLVVTDPGGISHTISDALTVRYKKPLSLAFSGGYGIPLAESAHFFTAGGALEAGVTYHLPESIVELGGSLSYGYEQTQALSSLSIAAARATVGAAFPLLRWLSALYYASGGYYFTTMNDFSVSASDPFVGGGLGLLFSVSPDLSFNVAAEYQYYLGLWQGLSLGIGTRIALDTQSGEVRQQPVARPPGEPENRPKPLLSTQKPVATEPVKSY